MNVLPAPIKHDLFIAIAHAIDTVFIWAIPAMAAAFVVSLFIKEIPLRGRDRQSPTPTDAADIAAQDAQESGALAALE